MTSTTKNVSRAVLYTRVSTDEQAENGTSLSVQLSSCLKKAEQLNAQVLRHHEDAGVSGARFDTRPGIQAALADIEAGRADTLIVYSISRLSRDREHQSVILRRVERAGGRVVFCDMAVEDSPEGKLLVNITGDFAEYERQLIRKRVMTGRQRRADEGLQPCRSHYMRPFGYVIPTKKDVLNGQYTLAEVGKYRVVPEEAQWVRGIFTRYAGGDSLRAICRWLEESGVATPRRGEFWRPPTVKRILDNPVYKGTAVFGRHRIHTDENLMKQGFSRPFRIVEQPMEQWTFIDAPAIVDAAVWEYCQERMTTAQKVYSGNRERKHLLSGLLLCPKCRRSMSGHRRERPQSVEYYYHCRDARPSRNAGKQVCLPKYFPGAAAEIITANVIRELAHHPELVEFALNAYREESEQDTDTDGEWDRVQKSLAALEDREKATVQAQIRGIQAGADPSVYDSVFAEISEKRAALRARLSELKILREAVPTPESAKDEAGLLAQIMADVEEALTAPELEIAERHDFLARVIEEIVPEGDGYRYKVRGIPGLEQTVANVKIL